MCPDKCYPSKKSSRSESKAGSGGEKTIEKSSLIIIFFNSPRSYPYFYTMNKFTFNYEQLWEFAHSIFIRIGCPPEQAKQATDVLLRADLRGIDSHGLARLSGYIRLWEAKRINSAPRLRIVHESPSTAVVDGDQGLGLVVAPFAMEVAIAKARTCGTGWVAVKNSNHFGIAGQHAMMALEHDMIGIAMTNASPLVAPTFSVERLLERTQYVLLFLPENNLHS